MVRYLSYFQLVQLQFSECLLFISISQIWQQQSVVSSYKLLSDEGEGTWSLTPKDACAFYRGAIITWAFSPCGGSSLTSRQHRMLHTGPRLCFSSGTRLTWGFSSLPPSLPKEATNLGQERVCDNRNDMTKYINHCATEASTKSPKVVSSYKFPSDES